MNVLAGITGSSSGGMSIALQTLGNDYLAMAEAAAISPELLHRVAVIAAGCMDTLPHCGAIITLLAICKLNHRQSYGDIAAVTILFRCPRWRWSLRWERPSGVFEPIPPESLNLCPPPCPRLPCSGRRSSSPTRFWLRSPWCWGAAAVGSQGPPVAPYRGLDLGALHGGRGWHLVCHSPAGGLFLDSRPVGIHPGCVGHGRCVCPRPPSEGAPQQHGFAVCGCPTHHGPVHLAARPPDRQLAVGVVGRGLSVFGLQPNEVLRYVL